MAKAVITLTSGLVLTEKIGGVAISSYIAEVITPKGVAGLIDYVLVPVVIYSVVMSATGFFEDFFPQLGAKTQEPESLSAGLLVINREIKMHLDDFQRDPVNACKTFQKAHQFEVNVAVAVEELAKHLMRAFRIKGLKKRDIFISVYQGIPLIGGKTEKLEYVVHWDPNRDTVFSKSIDIHSTKYKGYESVKAILNNTPTAIVWDGTKYKASRSGRKRGNPTHYLGLKIDHGDHVLGFLNIEFHTHKFFADESSMVDFVEKEIIPFKYLVEYQFLKRKFFNVVRPQLKEAL